MNIDIQMDRDLAAYHAQQDEDDASEYTAQEIRDMQADAAEARASSD